MKKSIFALSIGLILTLPALASAQTSSAIQDVTKADAVHNRIHSTHLFKVEAVTFASSYALVFFTGGETGGEHLYRYQGGIWRYVGGGGGVVSASEMAALYHVPIAVAQSLVNQMAPHFSAPR